MSASSPGDGAAQLHGVFSDLAKSRAFSHCQRPISTHAQSCSPSGASRRQPYRDRV
ncbi:hypothetical protein M440DRAFT_1402679 [Trichoderma longibrachiatum ATCC 18648]|uniref:Uncharacterized protein n=1 Tax=Trichoderma longibrachiatum ATCC 18648 TaxID=983965 RepID=A0A2T4C0L5_TRILO|nr:hypothetical protein M440DRAFT_1402679 [Trichoderma longibrachiatum ATCC 18648]